MPEALSLVFSGARTNKINKQVTVTAVAMDLLNFTSGLAYKKERNIKTQRAEADRDKSCIESCHFIV